MTSLLTMRRVLAGGLASGLLAVALFPATASAAHSPITFDIRYGDECLDGHSTPGGTATVNWTDAMGQAKATGTFPDSSGYWSVCSENGLMAIGDKVRVDDGTATRKYVVPNFFVVADRVTNKFYGNGPAGRTITIVYPAGSLADYTYQHHLRVAQDGTFSFRPRDLGDISGGDFVYIHWKSPKNDTLEADSTAASVALTLGSAKFGGTTAPGETANFALRDGSSNAKLASATATASLRNDEFVGRFTDSDGNPVQVMPGQHFKAPSLASDADFIVPNIDASADKSKEKVTGRCYDAGTGSGNYYIDIVRTGHVRGYLYGYTSDPDGFFTANFSGRETPGFNPANIKSGDKVTVVCRQSTGDSVAWSFMVP